MRAASSHPGVSIAVKLVIATSIVVAATVVSSSLYALNQAEETARVEQSWRDQTIDAAARFEARLTAMIAAQSLDYVVSGEAWVEVAQVMRDVGNDSAATVGAGERPRLQPTWFMLWDVEANPSEAVRKWPGAFGVHLAPGPEGLIYRSEAAPASSAEVIQLERSFAAVPLEARHGDLTELQIDATNYVFRAPVGMGKYTRAHLWIGISTQALHSELGKVAIQAQEHVRSLRVKLWVSVGVALLLGIVLAMLLGMNMARPIAALSAQATRMAQGDFDRRVPVDRRDELGTLARNFNFMADRIGELLLEQAEKAALEHEMDLARSVQQAMLPASQVERVGHVSVVGYCAPASSCGGDWWMHRKLAGDRLLIVVGDATGHGIHSAMIAATARGAVEALAAIDERMVSPEQVLRAIDSAIRNVGEHHVLMTAFAAVIDTMSGILQYANAGQNFPYVLHSADDGTLGGAAILAAPGNPLGDQEIAVHIRSGARQLRRGELFLCFTDGLVERANPDGELFGDRRLLRALRGQPLGGARELEALRLRVMHEVDAYAAGADAEDDVTFVFCHFDPPAVPQELRHAGTA